MQKIENYIAELLEGIEENDIFLVETVLNGKKLQVFLDSETGVTLKACQSLSRKIEAYIEENSLLAEDYTLEVSSPGLDRPLKLKRQFYKNKNRKIKTITAEGKTLVGSLQEVNEEAITLLDDKKNKIEIKWGEMDKTFVLPAF